jgi:hypothetical protein
VKLLKKFEQRQANHLFWSPVNDFLVLANVKSQQGCEVVQMVVFV